MAKLLVHGPFDERDLHDDLRDDPMHPDARQSFRASERRPRNFDGVESRAQIEEECRIEARADLAREDEIVSLEIAHEQRSQADAPTLRIGESAYDKVLGELALHLEPGLRALLLVNGIEPLRDHAFPPFGARSRPWFGVIERLDALQRSVQRNSIEDATPLRER